MNESTLQLPAILPLAVPLLLALLRTGLVLAFSALALAAFLRVCRVASPTVRRVAYVAVLVQGWLFLQGPFAVPLPKFLEAMAAKASADGLAQRAPASVADQSLDELLSRAGGPRPLGPRTSAAPPDVRGGQPRGLWYANEWDSLTSQMAGCRWREPAIGAGPRSRRLASALQLEVRSKSEAFFEDQLRQSQTLASRRIEDTGRPPASWAGADGRISPRAPEIRTIVPNDADDFASTNHVVALSSPFPWPLALIGVWAAGIVVLIGRAAWNYVRVVRQMPPLAEVDPEWADEWAELQRQAGIRRVVPLAVAEHAGPVLFRLPRGYRLIVPAAAWRTLERSQRLSILRHELAHIERRDVWKSLAVRALALPHWLHPLVWHCVRRFDECAEWACDEAARRGAPEHVPDYARALLQLVQRAEPVFFATRAAREHGLSHRIRRLLTPAQEKGSAMKTAVLFALVLGISLVNLTRLQTRADDESPQAVNVTVTSAPQAAGSTVTVTATPAAAPRASTTPAPAAATTAVVNPAPAAAVAIATPVNTTLPSAAMTITAVPVAAPATIATPRASTTPMAASATSAITIVGVAPSVATTAQPAALPAPVAGATTQPATASPAALAPIGLPASQDPFTAPARASTPAGLPSAPSSATSLPAPSPFGLRGTVAATAPSSGLSPADPTAAADPLSGSAASESRQARADLGYILKNMNEFKVRQQVLDANNLSWQKLRASQREEMVRIAKARIAAEKDPLIKDLLEKGIAQKSTEMADQTNSKLAGEAKQLRDQILAKIVAEIARYAQEHHLLVVRRADFASSGEGYVDYYSVPITVNPSIFSRDQQQAPPKLYGRDAIPEALYNVFVNTDTPSNAWDREVLYVAGRDHQYEADISDDIVKRLNAAYAAGHTEGGKKNPQ